MSYGALEPRKPAQPTWVRKLADLKNWYAWARDGRKPSGRRNALIHFAIRHLNSPPIRVDVDATPAQLDKLRHRVESTWTKLGGTEPHWSVLTAEKYRSRTIAQTREEFYATGQGNYLQAQRVLARNGVNLAELSTVLDYGCGVGRVSSAFARAGHKVVAADISPNHIEAANAYFREEGLAQVETHRMTKIDDIDTLPEVDLFFTTIVLQHNPPPIIAQVLRKALGRIRQGGYAYFQLQTYRSGYVYDVAADADATTDHMEMHVLPQRDVFRILDETGFRPLEVHLDGNVPHAGFESHTFVAERLRGATTH